MNFRTIKVYYNTKKGKYIKINVKNWVPNEHSSNLCFSIDITNQFETEITF